MIRNILKKILKRLPGVTTDSKEDSLQALARVYQRMNERHRASVPFMADKSSGGIVFSKDRALQLHALLSSYFACTKNPARLHVLYKTSSDRHSRSYKELRELFRDSDIAFIPEASFREDLERLIAGINAAWLFFMTDDGIFIDSYDMNDLLFVDPLKVVPTLIKGLDLTYCFIQDKQQSLPEFIQPAGTPLPANVKCWEWGQAQRGSDWAYPLSLDVSFYDKYEMQALIENISYEGPNSLENALHENYAPVFLQRKGLCFAKAKYVNVTCNVVNNEHKNRHTGLHSIAELLERWEAGERIVFEDFYGKTCAEAESSSFRFAPR